MVQGLFFLFSQRSWSSLHWHFPLFFLFEVHTAFEEMRGFGSEWCFFFVELVKCVCVCDLNMWAVPPLVKRHSHSTGEGNISTGCGMHTEMSTVVWRKGNPMAMLRFDEFS